MRQYRGMRVLALKLKTFNFNATDRRFVSPHPVAIKFNLRLNLIARARRFLALRRRVPSVPAKGPGTSAEGSQICDLTDEDSKSASRILKLAIASFKILAQKYFKSSI